MTECPADLDQAKARCREMERQMGFCRGPILMMASSTEAKRAAWKARNDRRGARKKNGWGWIVLKDVPHDVFIGAMLDLGIYLRPVGRAPSFSEALQAFESHLRGAAPYTRVTKSVAPSFTAGEIVNAPNPKEAATHEHAREKS